jgi:hypothetical protein
MTKRTPKFEQILGPKVYLSGPMTGIPEFNYPAFTCAAAKLRDSGMQVFNPAESFSGDTTKPYDAYMREDIRALLDVEAVYVLDGWEKSTGAVTEVLTALSLNLPIFDMDNNNIFDGLA